MAQKCPCNIDDFRVRGRTVPAGRPRSRSGRELKQTFCMKRFREVVGKALVSGLIVVVPVYLCLLLLLKAAHSLGGLVRPLARLLPPWLPAEKAFSIALVLSICFLVGLAVRTPFGSTLRERIENRLFRKIPGYHLFQGLLEQLTGASQGQVWKPALAEIESALVPAFIIEEVDDGRFTVFVPSVPTPLAGSIYILDASRVHPLNIPFTQAIKAVSQWGSGCKDLIASMNSEKDSLAEGERREAGSASHSQKTH